MASPHSPARASADAGVATDERPVPFAKQGVPFDELVIESLLYVSLITARQPAEGVELELNLFKTFRLPTPRDKCQLWFIQQHIPRYT